MLTNMTLKLKTWLKTSHSPTAKWLFRTLKSIAVFDLPLPQFINLAFYKVLSFVRNAYHGLLRVFILTPAFRGRCSHSGKQLYLYGGLPFVTGPLDIALGDHCRISGQTTFSASSHTRQPSLHIGNNVDVGWQTTIAVGTKVIIEDNVRIAGRSNFFGYSGHPIDPEKRARGEADDLNQIGDIILKRDCWLGTNVIVKAGVTIGQNSIIAAGSVVTKSIPDNVIAAGNPATIVRHIDTSSTRTPLEADYA